MNIVLYAYLAEMHGYAWIHTYRYAYHASLSIEFPFTALATDGQYLKSATV